MKKLKVVVFILIAVYALFCACDTNSVLKPDLGAENPLLSNYFLFETIGSAVRVSYSDGVYDSVQVFDDQFMTFFASYEVDSLHWYLNASGLGVIDSDFRTDLAFKVVSENNPGCSGLGWHDIVVFYNRNNKDGYLQVKRVWNSWIYRFSQLEGRNDSFGRSYLLPEGHGKVQMPVWGGKQYLIWDADCLPVKACIYPAGEFKTARNVYLVESESDSTHLTIKPRDYLEVSLNFTYSVVIDSIVIVR